VVARVFVVFGLLAGALAAPPAHAQPASRPASLRVTVADQLGAILVGAIVQARAEGQPEAAAALTVTDERGVASIEGLAPGIYVVRVMFEGFDPVELRNVQLKPGQGRREAVMLSIASLSEEVNVRRDPRESATDPRGDGFTTRLGEKEIEALPDDPDELEEAINQMAGPGTTIRVGGFKGGALPPKSQIREIRFRRNSFAAENHESGSVSVDILTRPGFNGWRGSVTFGFRDDSMNARNALAPRKVDEQQSRGGLTFDGPLWKGRTSLSVGIDGFSAFDTQTILAAAPGGEVNAAFRRPTDRLGVNVRVEHGLTKTHVLRGEYQSRATDSGRLGVGDLDLPERAYSRTNTQRVFRVGTDGPIGKRVFAETRVQLRWNETETTPFSSDPTVRVSGAFNAGGASSQGWRDQRDLEIAQNFDYTAGKHVMRAGLLADGLFTDSTTVQNAHGTFTFPTLDSYNAGLPSVFSQRQGDPRVDYSMWQVGWYAQDDIRLRKSLTVSLGLRQEWQSYLDDTWNLAPRAGFVWSPFENGRTTIRGGAGIFYDWYEADTYEQTLQVDGERLTDVVIRNPGYPDPFSGGSAAVQPPGVIRQAEAMQMPAVAQGAIGLERSFGDRARVNASYVYRHGTEQLRARATNLPAADGVRPDPAYGNITVIDSTGGLDSHAVTVGGNVRLDRPRLFLAGNYTLGRFRDDGNGPLSLPADSASPDEWGPARNDVRHRLSLFGNLELPWSLRLGVNLRAESAAPYNITTGVDNNGDTIFTDRPAGVERNSARGDEVIDLGLRLSYRLGFGERRQPTTPGSPGGPGGGGGGPQVVVMRGEGGDFPGGGMGMMRGGGPGNSRISLEFYVQAFNVLNETNLTNYNGVIASPLYGTAGAALPPRRIEIGTRVVF
jgi:hypothetical protein